MNKKCQVFTPENYVIELLDSVGYTHNLYGKKILENSCGDGNILVAVVQRYIDDCKENGLSRTRIKNGLAKDIYGIEIDEEQYKKDKRKRLKKNIYDTIEKIVNVLQPILVQKKVQVELIKDEQNAERRIFESDFESIFYNLIINSIEAFSKSSTKNRKIRIELKTNENLVVNYLDNGDGLDNKFKNPYEIFTLGSTSKYDQFGNVIGTGLGMYIIASTVREYNGDYKLTQIQNGFGLEIRIPL